MFDWDVEIVEIQDSSQCDSVIEKKYSPKVQTKHSGVQRK